MNEDWDDEDFARDMIGQDPSNFRNCSERLKDDEGLARLAIEWDSRNFEHCSERLKDDDAFAQIAVENHPWNFGHCSERLRKDPVFWTFGELVSARGRGPRIDLPASLRAAYKHTLMLYPEVNCPEFRQAFLIMARAPKPDPNAPLPTRVEHPEIFDSLSF